MVWICDKCQMIIPRVDNHSIFDCRVRMIKNKMKTFDKLRKETYEGPMILDSMFNKEDKKCEHDWKQTTTNIDDLYIILECTKCKETMTVNI